MTKGKLREFALSMGNKSIEQLYFKLGQGEVSLHKVIERLDSKKTISGSEDQKESIFDRFITKAINTLCCGVNDERISL